MLDGQILSKFMKALQVYTACKVGYQSNALDAIVDVLKMFQIAQISTSQLRRIPYAKDRDVQTVIIALS